MSAVRVDGDKMVYRSCRHIARMLVISTIRLLNIMMEVSGKELGAPIAHSWNHYLPISYLLFAVLLSSDIGDL